MGINNSGECVWCVDFWCKLLVVVEEGEMRDLKVVDKWYGLFFLVSMLDFVVFYSLKGVMIKIVMVVRVMDVV